ncbi:hypothetical protein C8Q79DRAFT_1011603 [Trametes meyenii]|nr:hypothetical protein C8Q79DRAFT_1011603 [Trametes meyenii]
MNANTDVTEPTAESLANKAEVVHEILGEMRARFGYLTQTLSALEEQGELIKKLGPSMTSVEEDFDRNHKLITAHDEEQKKQFDALKADIRGRVKSNVLSIAEGQIREQIQTEVAKQVGEQIKTLLVPTHFPKSLEDHAQDGRTLISALGTALANSKARRENATITEHDMTRPLAIVLKDDGTKSDAWPADLNSLTTYNALQLRQLRQLIEDFDLHDHGNAATNLNRFLAHIGVVGLTLVSPGVGTAVLASGGVGR